MQYPEELRELWIDLGKMTEFERYKMGMGKYAFAKMIGIHYHTYSSFLKQSNMTHMKTFDAINAFLKTRDIKEEVWDALWARMQAYIFREAEKERLELKNSK